MDIRHDLLELIGNTPLVRLTEASDATGCEIFGKCEFMNPGGSVKDRAALYIVKDALERDAIRPGGIIVEGTAGNTGIGLAVVGNALDFRSLIVMNDNLAQEKTDALRMLGAEVELVPQKPYKDSGNYNKVAEQRAKELGASDPNGAIWANQFDNLANRRAHIETTGPEIWRQTDGKVDGFVSAIGTGGTLSGVGLSLKEKNSDIVIALADPMGAAMYSYFTTGDLASEGNSVTEGIGQGRITENVDGTPVDRAYQIPDEEALAIMFDLVRTEGLLVGGSTGINIAGAIRLAKDMGPGHTIVTILCDSGARYQSKLFNPEFLREKNLTVPDWLED